MGNPEDLIAGIMLLGWFVAMHVGMAGVFRKAQLPAWHAFIPGWNAIQLCKVAGLSPLWLLAIFVPLLNLGFALYLGIRLSQRFGYADWFGILLGLTGLALLPIVGFSNHEALSDAQIERAFVPAYCVAAWGIGFFLSQFVPIRSFGPPTFESHCRLHTKHSYSLQQRSRAQHVEVIRSDAKAELKAIVQLRDAEAARCKEAAKDEIRVTNLTAAIERKRVSHRELVQRLKDLQLVGIHESFSAKVLSPASVATEAGVF